MLYYINYDKSKLTIFADSEAYEFNLRDGDVGEFWNSFEHDGKVFDVNMHQESVNHVPTVCIYTVKDNGVLWNTCQHLVGYAMGKAENYFNPIDVTLSWGLFY